MEKEAIEDLLLRYYEGVTTEEETVWVEEWLNASEENKRTALQIQMIVLAANVAQASSKIDVGSALSAVHRKMNIGNRYHRLLIGMQRAAAILFIPLAISWFMLYIGKGKQEEVRMMEVRTNPGMTTTVELPDGTEVTLNSSSQLRYPSRFAGDRREVHLVGEAFFSVVKSEKQFVVGTLNRSEVSVHGTEFNVEAYGEDHTVQTTLVSGSVSFSYVDNGKRSLVRMQPGQQAVYDIEQGKVILKKVNVDVATSWKDGRLIFKNTPFDTVLKNLSKRYNVKFRLKNASLMQNSFTATFTKQRLERILEHFRISSNIHFKYVEDDGTNTERQVIEVY
ncbi:FecR family protein [Bacteroides rodentium]